MVYKMSIEKIREFLEQENISQAEFAKHCGVQKRSFKFVLAGKRKNLSRYLNTIELLKLRKKSKFDNETK